MRRLASESLLHAAVLAFGLGLWFWPTIASGFRLLQTDPGDTLLNHYLLEHTWRCLSQADYVGTLWSPPFFHPQPDVLAYSENLLGVAPAYWALRLFCPALLAYQLWMLTLCAANYASMAWALRQWEVRPALAALGGFVFAFGLPRFIQLGHQQLLAQPFTPLALWFTWRFLAAPSLRLLAAAMIFCLWQLAACVYLGWFLALLLPIFAAGQWAAQPGRLTELVRFLALRKWSVAALLLAGAAATTALAVPYLKGNQGYRRGYIGSYLPCRRSWLAPPDDSLWAPLTEAQRQNQDHERRLFPGLLPLLLLAGAGMASLSRRALERDDRALVRAGLLAVGAAYVLTVRWHNHTSLWRFMHDHLPGADAIRVPGRIVLAALAFGLPAGLVAADRLLGRRTWAMAVSFGLLVLGIADQVATDRNCFEAEPFFAAAERKGEAIIGQPWAYLPLEPGRQYYTRQLEAMWAGLLANVPVVNGYSGRSPLGYPEWDRTMTPAELEAWLRRAGASPQESATRSWWR